MTIVLLKCLFIVSRSLNCAVSSQRAQFSPCELVYDQLLLG